MISSKEKKMSFRVLVTSIPMLSTIEACQERFAAENLEVVAPQITRQYPEAELCEMIADFDGVFAGDDPFTAKVLEIGRQGRLRALVRVGIGIDAVDMEATKRLGIAFSNTPGVFSDEVAEVAIGYLILLARGLHTVDAAVRVGLLRHAWFACRRARAERFRQDDAPLPRTRSAASRTCFPAPTARSASNPRSQPASPDRGAFP